MPHQELLTESQRLNLHSPASDERGMVRHAAFQSQVETNANYHAELHKRLSQLPQEIADGVKPEAIVKAMSESFRQQIQEHRITGNADVAFHRREGFKADCQRTR